MKRYLAAALILLAGTGAGSAQAVLTPTTTGPVPTVPSAIPGPVLSTPMIGPVPSAPNVLSQSPDSIDPNTILVNPAGSPSIASPRVGRGTAPLIVPNDPLGVGITNVNPFGGGSIGSTSNISGTILGRSRLAVP